MMEINFLKKYLRQFVLFLCFFGITCGIFAQDLSKLRISVEEKNASIRQILGQVERTYNIRFFYDEKVINVSPVKSISLKNVTLSKFINVLFNGSATYNTSGNGLVTLVKADEQTKDQKNVNPVADTVQAAPKPVQQKDRLLQVKGKIVDSNNEPLIGAAVAVKGSRTKGVIADVDGNFAISVDPNAILTVSYIGFKPREIMVNGQANISITLQEDAVALENVVVTGFQNIQKKNFTGSATKVKSDNLQIKGAIDISRMLEGQVAGVAVQNVSGTFGAAPKVRVRGVTSINGENKPLWVIDGVVHEDIINVTNDQLTSGDPNTLLGSAVAGLNANDIESIDILKDASATALYGARAMNGVIVVTTKGGKEGRPVVTYSNKTSIQLKPTYANYDIMNSAEQMSVYAELERKGFLNSDIVNSSNSGVYGKMYKLINTYDETSGKFMLENTQQAREQFLMKYAAANTDWFDILFKNSLVQEHSISISAGSPKSRTYASLSYLNDEGWSIADKVNRYTANLKNDYNINKDLRIGIQLLGSIRKQKAPGSTSRISNVVEGSYDREFDINPFSYAINTSRVLRAYDDDGNLEYFTRNYAPFNIINELQNNQIILNVLDMKAQADASWKFLKNFRWDFVGSIRYVKSDREHQIKDKSNQAEAYRAAYTATIRDRNRYLYSNPDNPNEEPLVVLPYGGFYNRYEDFLTSYDFRNSIVYSKVFNGKHNLNILAGQQIKLANRQNFNMTGFGYQYDQGGVPFVDYRIIKQFIEGGYDYYGMDQTYDRFAAFYGNADYTYDGRYAFSATLRYDGSNSLGKNASARWLPTYNIGGKWNVSEEQFAKEWEWLTYMSLRASYGLTASMPPAANASAVFYNTSTRRPYTKEIESVIRLSNLENAELTWEKGFLFNVGADLAFFNKRVDLTIDYWRRNSFDLISSFKTSGIGGELSKLANYADMKSSGVDLAIGLIPLKVSDFEWRVNFTYGYSKNKITNAENLPRIYDMVNPNGGNLEGYPVKSLFSVKFVGLEHDTGIPNFIDESGDVSRTCYMQSTDLSNLKYEGQVDPKYVGGIGNTFKYKEFSLNIFLSYQGGNVIRMNPYFKSVYSDLNAMPRMFYNRWLMPGDEQYTNVPSIVDSYTYQNFSSTYPYNTYNYSSAMVAKGDFVRLKTISLSYELPGSLVQKTKCFSRVSCTLAASNLCLLYADKKLNGQDPEFFNSGGVAQPLQRQFTLVLNLGF